MGDGRWEISGVFGAHFVNIAETSATEVDYLLELITDLGMLPAEVTAPLRKEYDEICRMLNRFRARLSAAG